MSGYIENIDRRLLIAPGESTKLEVSGTQRDVTWLCATNVSGCSMRPVRGEDFTLRSNRIGDIQHSLGT
ncbi:MAG: hypothetical protein KGQ89_11760, partial [Verrucomicrobia bacterium]|nr:hypothetical protein [Verrucomicrobiota bacterium]